MQLANSEQAVVVNPRDKQLDEAWHNKRGQRHVDNHSTAFELEAEDGNIVKAPEWPKALLAEHVCEMLKKSTVVAVPPQARYRRHF